MSEIHAQGTVVEARTGLLILIGSCGETLHDGLRPHDARPGDYVWIYDDGKVEVQNRPPRLPGNVTETTLPTSLDGPDHSSGG